MTHFFISTPRFHAVPPDEPRIFDTHGKEITTIAGPFHEGQEFFLSCQVSGGSPPPKVSWWRSNVEIPGTSHQSIVTGAVVNNILMRAVPRDYYATKLTCRAQGSPLIDPVEKDVTIQLHRKSIPTNVPTPHHNSLRNPVSVIRFPHSYHQQ